MIEVLASLFPLTKRTQEMRRMRHRFPLLMHRLAHRRQLRRPFRHIFRRVFDSG